MTYEIMEKNRKRKPYKKIVQAKFKS